MNNPNVSGSQLRDILQQQHLAGDRLRSYSNYISCNGPSSNNSSSGDDNSSRLYKFKSNMKHRFSVDLEHSHKSKKQRRDSESSCGTYTDCEKDCIVGSNNHLLNRPPSHPTNYSNRMQDIPKCVDDGWDPALMPDKTENITPPPPSNCHSSPGPNISSNENSKNPVPIFALNQNGTYVPLVIDHSIVAPVMSGLQDISPVPHPISIYVNFCGPYHMSVSSGTMPSNHPLKTPGSVTAKSAPYPIPHISYPAHHPNSGHNQFDYHENRDMNSHRDERRRCGQHHDHHRSANNTQSSANVPTSTDTTEKKEMIDTEYRDSSVLTSVPIGRVDGKLSVPDVRSDSNAIPRDFMPPIHHPEMRHDAISREELRDSRELCDVRSEMRNFRGMRDATRDIRNSRNNMRDYLDQNFPVAGGYPRAHIPWPYHFPTHKTYKE